MKRVHHLVRVDQGRGTVDILRQPLKIGPAQTGQEIFDVAPNSFYALRLRRADDGGKAGRESAHVDACDDLKDVKEPRGRAGHAAWRISGSGACLIWKLGHHHLHQALQCNRCVLVCRYAFVR